MDGLKSNENIHIYIANVIGVVDDEGGDRIKAKILPVDKRLSYEQIPLAFPLLPKFFHIKPKIGESVLIICEDSSPNSQRFYIGPIISQPQSAYYENSLSATSLLDGGVKKSDIPAENKRRTKGAFAEDNEIAILGRKNSDIILSDDDIRIRCGAKLVTGVDNKNVIFNEQTPSFIKLKHYSERLKLPEERVGSTATIVADKINLISNNGDPYFKTTDSGEGISDKEMKRILQEAHKLPYGDNLVEFLCAFLNMFKSHTHKYDNLPPCPDSASGIFDSKYGGGQQSIEKILLSNNVRIN